MDYNDAIAAVNAGQYAWRPEWNGAYIYLFEGVVYQSTSTGPGHIYDPTPADKAATDFDTGDHPPHP
jgi:hypothetical protein